MTELPPIDNPDYHERGLCPGCGVTHKSVMPEEKYTPPKKPELKLIAITRGSLGVHLGHELWRGTAFGTLCGLNNVGVADDPNFERSSQIRGPGWRAVQTTILTCQECHDKGKEMHDASQG